MARSPQYSLSDLVEAHQEALVRFLTMRFGNAEDAAEIAQEAYLRLMGVERLEELENPRGFLFRTATNLALDRTRQQTRLARLHRHLALQTRTDQGQPSSPGGTSPEADLQARERMQQVAEVVRKLPYKCGRAFILHRFEGRTHAEIARELGVSRSMVEKYLIRALARLRRELRPGAEDSGRGNR